MKVAIVGSRKYPDLDRVGTFTTKLWERYGREMTLVSGGAEGVDRRAEETWQQLGGEVYSYRIKKLRGGQEIEDEYGFEIWVLASGEDRTSFVWIPRDEPTWANATSALWWRNKMIARDVERGVAFWDGRSRGTNDAVDAFYAEDKPMHVFKGTEASDGAES